MINLIVSGDAMSETKKPSSPHWNAFPIAAGLELTAPQSGPAGRSFGLNADLNCGQEPLSGPGVSFRLGVRTGLLRLDLEGCAVVPGTRFAVRDQPATVQREMKREESGTQKTERSLLMMLGLGPRGVAPNTGIGASASSSQAKVQTTLYRQEGVEDIHKVTARGTNSEPSWEIIDPENSILDGHYLGLENLCDIALQAERYEVMAEFVCRRRDLALSEIECSNSPWSRSITKEKLALAVVASELGKTLEQLEEGMLTLCRSVLASIGRRDGQG